MDKEQLEQMTAQVYNRGVKPHLPQHHLSMSHKKQLNAIYGSFNTALLTMLWLDGHVNW